MKSAGLTRDEFRIALHSAGMKTAAACDQPLDMPFP